MKQRVQIPLLFFCLTLLFFYPLLKGHVPFPGDNLVANFAPYNTYAHLGYAPGGVPNKAQGHDVIREAFPWKFFVIESFKNGQIPFWTPYNFSGSPLMANFQSAVFYPLNLIFFLLPFLQAWSLFIFLAPFFAALFTYFFLQELKVSKVASIFGGMIFAFSSYMVVWLEYGNITHTYLWLPLALLFTEKLTKKFRARDVLFLILCLSFSLLGGYIQGYFYIFSTIIIYFLSKTWFSKKISFIEKVYFFIALSFPALLTLFQILPTLELFAHSSRNNYSLDQIERMLNPWWYAITVIIPDFFGNPAVRSYWFNGTYIEQTSYFGLIPFIFALVALFSFKLNKNIKIFAALFIITFVMALNLLFIKYIYLIPLPTLSTTIPTRILGLFDFCGAILAAYGFELLLQKKQKKLFIQSTFFSISIILATFLFTIFAPKFFPNSDWVSHLSVSKRNTILPFIFALSFAAIVFFQFYIKKSLSVKGILLIPIIILIISIGDLFYFFHKITPFSPKDFVYPKSDVVEYLLQNAGTYRFWGYGSGYVDSNFQAYDKTYSPEGYDPLHVKSYSELLNASVDGKLPKIPSRSDANIAPGYGSEDLTRNMYRKKVLDLLGVKYLLNKDGSLGEEDRPDKTTFAEKKYDLIWQKTPWQIYENKDVLPRALLVSDYIVEKDKKKILKMLFDNKININQTVIVEEKLPFFIRKNKTRGRVEIKEYTPNKITLQTNSKSDEILFMSDNYYPGWNVFIDEEKGKIYRADYSFRAVPIRSGKHEVIFMYKPDSFKVGSVASIISLIGLGLFVGIIRRRKAHV
jgi:hypothetical protein